jgi:hypothetical protein
MPSRNNSRRSRGSRISRRSRDKSRKPHGLKLISIKKSTRSDKKLMATFSDGTITHFGASGYQNYGGVGKERHLDKERKERYIERHKSRENWSDPRTAGALSRFVLWNKDTLKSSILDYKKRFNL